MKDTTVTIIIIILILITNYVLAYLGNIYHLIYLAGVCLMLTTWKMIKEMLK